MFRFSAVVSGRRAGAVLPSLRVPLVSACQATALTGTWRWNSTQGNEKAATASANNANNNTNAVARRAGRDPVVLPPAFDVVHWNDADLSKGHLLRVVHRDSYVVLDYYQQAMPTVSENGAATPRSSRAERSVTLALPPVYVARLLSVLEGKAKSVEIKLRTTTATFDAVGPHAHRLSCSTTRITQEDSAPTTKEWAVDFDPAESLLLHRFLTQCLQYNTGFCHP